MNERDNERSFQYKFAKLQVVSRFATALLVGTLATAYAMLSYYRDNPSLWLGTCTVITIVIGLLIALAVWMFRELKQIRQQYVD
jgi:uncharacterized protein (DUF983 family)